MTAPRIRIALLLAAALLAAVAFALRPAAAAEAPAAPVGLKGETVVIEGATVRLGDVFHGLGAEAGTPIARAPEPGGRLRLPARWLARVARAYGLDWRPRSALDGVVVRRASTVVGPAAVRQAVRAALARRGLGGEVELRLDGPEPGLRLPKGEPATVAVTGLTYRARSGRFVAHLAAPDAARPAVRTTVTGEAVRMVEVPVPARRIAAGEVIGRDDLTWARVRADRLARNRVTAASALVGKAPRRALRPGVALRASDVRRPRLVEKNALVTIEFRTARMHLTARGRALQAGARGETVRVVNSKSRSTMQAVVVGPSTVSVGPGAGGREAEEGEER